MGGLILKTFIYTTCLQRAEIPTADYNRGQK